MSSFFPTLSRTTATVIGFACFPAIVLSQSAAPRNSVEESGGMGLVWIVVLAAVLAVGAVFLWRKFSAGAAVDSPDNKSSTKYYNSNESYDIDGVEVERELQLFKKSRKPSNKAGLDAKKNFTPETSVPAPKRSALIDLDTKAFQDKMRKMQYAQLPINSFTKLTPAKLYDPLSDSNDPALLSAIEQANEEFEEDETVRELALKILTAFRSRNSVEALTQIALYDLSSNLRSKAVSTLTDFDHPSVFEPILLACADPTREVRAAAARGLFRLSFDRADAWKRILETNDEYRMIHASRAAIESGIAVKSFERLVHEDLKVAKEAFSLVAFMIGAGEHEEIFKAIRNHRDERVRFALIHVLKVQQDHRTLAGLEQLRTGSLTPDVAERVKDAIASFAAVPV